ncbi:MAG: AGE family epimerase/isomerase [Terricaulis sp.]
MQKSLPKVSASASSKIDFARLRAWMFDDALPLWADRGIDRAHGGFLEELTPDAQPTTCSFKRVRVICRQIYVFAHAAKLGWQQGADIAEMGFVYLRDHARLADGGWARRLSREGAIIDPTPDLYDISFVLFALSWRYRLSADQQVLTLMYETLDYIQHKMKGPHGGFWHALPPQGARVQNPHMHLVEASHVAFEATSDKRFLEQADEVIGLLRTKFFDGVTLGEFFTEDWAREQSEAGRTLEPGHQFEWAWILSTHQRLKGVDFGREMAALTDFAERFGVDPATQVSFDAVSPEGDIITANSRTWPNTERIKAWVALADRTDLQPIERINGSLDLLFTRYFGASRPGLWIDQFDGKGAPMVSAVPASILYHIFLAFSEVLHLEPTAQ